MAFDIRNIYGQQVLKNSRKSIQHYTPSINATADDLIEAVRQGLFLLSFLYQSSFLKSYLFSKLHGRLTKKINSEMRFSSKISLSDATLILTPAEPTWCRTPVT